MEITKKIDSGILTFAVSGSINTQTAPALEKEVQESLTEEISSVVFDFKDLDYISSAGLRILLIVVKKLKNGKLTIINAKQEIKDIFEMTGFDSFLIIK